jgi:putative two-component system response regulator
MVFCDQASIMVVDDEPANLRLLRELLSQQGYEVQLFSDGQLALSEAVSRPPDLILLDVNMPEMDGYEVCGQLRAYPSLAQTPVIFLSASDGVEDKVKAFRCGAADYITKPFQFDEFQSRIEMQLKLHRLQLAQQLHASRLEELVRARTRDLEESRLDVLHRLAIAAEYRDSNTGQHTQRVGYVSARLAEMLGVPGDQTELIRLAAPLHDVGKIGIPDQILLSNRKLTISEFQAMKFHVLIGSDILSGGKSLLLQMAESIARYHHERWDGAGYCAGIRGTAIPLHARIVAVADAFDALTHRRPYKEAWSKDAALLEINEQSGRQFDPQIVSALTDLVLSGEVANDVDEDIGFGSLLRGTGSVIMDRDSAQRAGDCEVNQGAGLITHGCGTAMQQILLSADCGPGNCQFQPNSLG